jgi:hypothetical protein
VGDGRILGSQYVNRMTGWGARPANRQRAAPNELD